MRQASQAKKGELEHHQIHWGNAFVSKVDKLFSVVTLAYETWGFVKQRSSPGPH